MKTALLSGVVLSALLVPGLSAAGQYYKWVDDKGITHFSEKPVLGADAKKVGTSSKTAETSPDPTPEAEPASAAEGNEAAQPQANNENCKSAQERLKALQSGQRIRLMGPDGKFSYLEQNQIKEEVQKTQEVLNANCKN